MSEPGSPLDTGEPEPDDASRLSRAKDIFLSVRLLGLAEREAAVDRNCAGDQALRELVQMLLRGDEAPLPFETLADDIRAATPVTAATRSIDPTSRPAPSVGGTDRIGNYRLLERLGEGGFGVVFMAEQERPVRRRIALKIIKLGMDTRRVVARFEAERQALALMDHPGIAKIFDAGATETGRPYFVMELVRGLPITEYCDAKKLPIRARLELISRVCDALQHAHQKGVIHRDIKPSNVLVTDVGDMPLPKIIDFGVAKATSARLTEKTIFTELRQMIGTPEYMSPEQASPTAEDVDTRTDVYSVGVLLYELLTGATPFDSSRLRSAAYEEVQRIIREEDPPRPSTRFTKSSATLSKAASLRSTPPARLSTTVRGELDWIVLKSMEKDRSRRYESASALARDIENYLEGRAVQAAPPSTVYRVRKFVKRNRGAVLAGSLLSLALVAGLIGTSVGFVRARAQQRIAVDERVRADENAAQARAAEALATRQAYSASMMSASTAINSVQYGTARTSLDAAPERLRGWEWRVLNAKLDSSIRAFVAGNRVPEGPDADWTHGLLLHPDGRSFFTTDYFANPSARQWDLETGRWLRDFPKPGDPIHTQPLRTLVSLSGDGSRLRLATIPLGEQVGVTLDLWDTSSGERIARNTFPVPAYPAHGFWVSQDGDRALFSNLSTTWTVGVPSGQVLETRPFLMNSMQGEVFRRDGAVFASSDRNNVVWIRDAKTMELIASMPGHANQVMAAVFSPDDRWLGSAADDDTARIWDLSASPPTSIVLKHNRRVGNIQFSPDSSLVATVAADKAIRVWDRATGALRATYASQSLINSPLLFMPDGKSVAGLELDGTVRFWDITAEDTRVLRGHDFIVGAVRFVTNNPAGLIISAGWDGGVGSTRIVRLWDSESGDLVGIHQGRLGDMVYREGMAVSADGRFAAVLITAEAEKYRQGDADRWRIEMLDLSTGERVFSEPSERPPYWVAFGADGSTILAADRTEFGANGEHSSRLHITDARSGRVIRTRKLEESTGWILALSPDGRTLLAMPIRFGGESRTDDATTMLVLDPVTLDTIREIDGITESVMSIAFSHDSTRFVICATVGGLYLHDLATGERLGSCTGHTGNVLDAAFSPDGARLASAGMDRVIRIWNTQTFDQVAALGGHEGHIGDLDWDESGERLVSCSGDTTVRIWEPEPVRTRVQARKARAAALARVEPMVARLFEELKEPAKVIEHLRADPSLDAFARKIALQTVIATSVNGAARISLKQGD